MRNKRELEGAKSIFSSFTKCHDSKIKTQLKKNLDLKKMNKSKTKKLALLTTVVILVVCFVPVVQGKQPSISTRPIEDWFANNPFGGSVGYGDPDSMLGQICLGWVEYDAESYEGIIIESLRTDQSLHFSIHISVIGMPMTIRNFNAIGTPGEWIFVGVMDFTYTAEFILGKKIPGGPLLDNVYDEDGIVFVPDNKGEPRPLIVQSYGEIDKGKREPGAELPVWWILYFYQHVVGGHFVEIEFISDTTSGNYIKPGWSPFLPGDPVLLGAGNVKVHQLAIYSYDLDLDDPDVFQYTEWVTPDGVFYEGGPLKKSPLLMPETWPVEFITFY